jgi:hypothetical protein
MALICQRVANAWVDWGYWLPSWIIGREYLMKSRDSCKRIAPLTFKEAIFFNSSKNPEKLNKNLRSSKQFKKQLEVHLVNMPYQFMSPMGHLNLVRQSQWQHISGGESNPATQLLFADTIPVGGDWMKIVIYFWVNKLLYFLINNHHRVGEKRPGYITKKCDKKK